VLQAYWFVVAYVSPVLLVMVGALLSWMAFRDSRDAHSESEGGRGVEDPNQQAPGRPKWSVDPDAWKK
jgi:hypothetical protein